MFRPMLALPLLLLLFPWTPTFSDDSAAVVPPKTQFAIQVDVATFRKTVLGKRFLKLTERMAAEEIGDDGEDVMANVKTALGFDPLTEIQSILVMASNLEDPEFQGVVVKLGKTTGNLEQLIQALPLMLSLSDYKTVEHAGHTIHSATDEGDEGFVAIHAGKQNVKWLLGSSEIDSVRLMLDGLSSQADTASPHRVIGELGDGNFAKIHLWEWAPDVFDFGDEYSDAVGTLKDVYATFKEDGDSINISVHVTVENQIQAAMTVGLVEMLAVISSLEASAEAFKAAKKAAGESKEAQAAYQASFKVYTASLGGPAELPEEPSKETANETSKEALMDAYLKAFPNADVETKLQMRKRSASPPGLIARPMGSPNAYPFDSSVPGNSYV